MTENILIFTFELNHFLGMGSFSSDGLIFMYSIYDVV